MSVIIQSTFVHKRFKKEFKEWNQLDKCKVEKILRLVKAIKKDPFRGIGKPEPLKFVFAGCWSRRIDGTHRLVYKVENGELQLMSCKYHYSKQQ